MTDDERAEKIAAFNARAAHWPTRTHCEIAREFDSPLLREALSVWREKAGGQPWPRREDMTPRAMKNFLPHVAIVEVVGSADTVRYRVRLAGSWVEQRVVPMTGKFLDEVIPEPQLQNFQSIFHLALGMGGPIRLFASGLKFQNKDYLDIEDFFAPLGKPREPASAVLAVLSSKPRPSAEKHERAVQSFKRGE